MGLLVNKTGVGILFLVAVLAMTGCANRGREELPLEEPTVTPIQAAPAIATFTPTRGTGSCGADLYGCSGSRANTDSCAILSKDQRASKPQSWSWSGV